MRCCDRTSHSTGVKGDTQRASKPTCGSTLLPLPSFLADSQYQVNDGFRKGENLGQMLHLRKIRGRRQAARRDVLEFQEAGHRGQDARMEAPICEDLVRGVEARARGLEVRV
jgi:hypothetical protein